MMNTSKSQAHSFDACSMMEASSPLPQVMFDPKQVSSIYRLLQFPAKGDGFETKEQVVCSFNRFIRAGLRSCPCADDFILKFWDGTDLHEKTEDGSIYKEREREHRNNGNFQ